MYKKISNVYDYSFKKPDGSVYLRKSSRKDSSTRYLDYKPSTIYVSPIYLHLLFMTVLLMIALVSYLFVIGKYLSFEANNFEKMREKDYQNPKYPGILLMGHFSGNNSVLAQKIPETYPKEGNNDTDKAKRQMFHFDSNMVNMNYKKNADQNVNFEKTTMPYGVGYGDENDYNTLVSEQENSGEKQMVENLFKNMFGLRNAVIGGKNGHYIINNVLEEENQVGVYEPRGSENKAVKILLEGNMDMNSNSQEKKIDFLKALLLNSDVQKNIKVFHHDVDEEKNLEDAEDVDVDEDLDEEKDREDTEDVDVDKYVDEEKNREDAEDVGVDEDVDEEKVT